jgi:hypothetical protein
MNLIEGIKKNNMLGIVSFIYRKKRIELYGFIKKIMYFFNNFLELCRITELYNGCFRSKK